MTFDNENRLGYRSRTYRHHKARDSAEYNRLVLADSQNFWSLRFVDWVAIVTLLVAVLQFTPGLIFKYNFDSKVARTDRNDQVGQLVEVALYGGGAVLAGTGAPNTKKHLDKQPQNEIRKGIGPSPINVAELAYPSVTGIIDSSDKSTENARAYGVPEK